MEELYRVANDYYMKLESFKTHGTFKNKYFWFSLFFALIFIISFGFYFLDFLLYKKQVTAKWSVIFNWYLFLTVVSEFFMISMMNKYRGNKEQNVIKHISNQMRPNCTSLEEAKVELLKSYFSCKQQEFSDYAEKINSMLGMAYQFSDDKSQIEQIFSFIYNKEANSRLVTLFVITCSIITVLSVSAGGNLYTVIDSFSGVNIDTFIKLFSVVLLLMLIIGFGFVQFVYFIKKIFVFLALQLPGESTKNIEAVKYLIRDLNRYHIFNKKENKIEIFVNKT